MKCLNKHTGQGNPRNVARLPLQFYPLQVERPSQECPDSACDLVFSRKRSLLLQPHPAHEHHHCRKLEDPERVETRCTRHADPNPGCDGGWRMQGPAPLNSVKAMRVETCPRFACTGGRPSKISGEGTRRKLQQILMVTRDRVGASRPASRYCVIYDGRVIGVLAAPHPLQI